METTQNPNTITITDEGPAEIIAELIERATAHLDDETLPPVERAAELGVGREDDGSVSAWTVHGDEQFAQVNVAR